MTGATAPDPLRRGPFGDGEDLVMAALFGPGAERILAATRQELVATLTPLYRAEMARSGVSDPSPAYLSELVVPLLLHLRAAMTGRDRPYLLGLAGGPGAGKSTLARLLCACLPMVTNPAAAALSLSLDDFYFDPEERRRRGFAWRTQPGTHDTGRLADFLAAMDRRDPAIAVPRYDLGRDRPGTDDSVPPPDVCVFDGAMIGSRLPGYDRLADRFDFLVFLDLPVALLKEWRFAREARIRARSGGEAGFHPDEMEAFWSEALEPCYHAHVLPNAARADLVLGLDAGRRVLHAGRGEARP